MGGIIRLCAWSRSAPASWASGGAFSTRHKRGLAGACPANEWRRVRPHSRNQVGKLSGLPGPSGPDPGTVVRAGGDRQASGMRIPPQIQQPAPHLRVVSRREMGKSYPTRPDRQEGSCPCTSGRSRCRCQGRSRRRSRTFCQFRVALPPSSGLTCSVRL